MTSVQGRIRPEPSHDLGFVGQAAIEEIVPVWPHAGVHRWGIGRLGWCDSWRRRSRGSSNSWCCCSDSGCCSKCDRLSGRNTDRTLFDELFVAGREIRKHLAIGG
jgi:hypothetical protein